MKSFQPRAQWSSFTSYVLVTTGAIVGLGNIFQFPFLVTEYGGLFLLFYILCEIGICLPLLFAELLIGRRGKQSPGGSISVLAMEADASPRWSKLGWLCFLIVFLTLSYYTVTAAFPIGYFVDSIKELYLHGNQTAISLTLSSNLMTSFPKLETWFVIFLLLAMAFIYRGINRGLEGVSCITVPAYFIILLVLAIYTCTRGNFQDSLQHLFNIHEGVPIYVIFAAALAFAFLKLRIGMGIMIVYGSYLPYSVPLGKSTIIIVCLDAIASLLSYFIIHPLMLEANPEIFINGLTHHNVIHLFSSVPHGLVIAVFFFFAAILAAWTPIIAMAETVVVTLIERVHLTRHFAAIVVTIGVLILGTFEVLTHMAWADIILFHYIALHSLLKSLSMGILVPICALFIVIFTGWIMKRQITFNELQFNPTIYKIWRFLISFVAPIVILVLLLTVWVLGSFSF